MNRFVNKIAMLALLFAVSACCNNGGVADKEPEKPVATNIIYMIGDGTALPQVYSTMMATGQNLAFVKFPYTGIVITKSVNKEITDSAAGGTALACGKKTNNSMVGMDADSVPIPSILEVMHDNGKSTGLVVTSYVTHATPASFYAKVPKRKMYEVIAEQMMDCDKLDVAIGGGRKHFNNREDGRDLLAEMRNKGWTVYDTLASIDTNCTRYAVIANDNHLPKAMERGDFLPEGVKTALATLSKNKNGFFLMVEGSQIDFGAHANDSLWMVNETVDFSNAINVALEFAKADGHTLVVVTADHETGGLTMVDPEGKYSNVNFKYSTNSHSCLPVMVYAYGPGAEQFTGWMDNTEIIGKMFKAANVEDTTK